MSWNLRECSPHTYQVSQVTCQVSRIWCNFLVFVLTKWLSYLVEGLLSIRPTRLVYDISDCLHFNQLIQFLCFRTQHSDQKMLLDLFHRLPYFQNRKWWCDKSLNKKRQSGPRGKRNIPAQFLHQSLVGGKTCWTIAELWESLDWKETVNKVLNFLHTNCCGLSFIIFLRVFQ